MTGYLRGRWQDAVRSPLIFPLYLPTLIFAFCQGLLVPILPLYAVDFEVSYGLVGLLLAGEGLGRLFGDVPAGILLRRLGQKWAMLAGLGTVTLLTVALFWANSIYEAFLYQLVVGFGIALFNIARHAYLAETITLTNRGKAIALFGGVNRIGRFAGPAVAGIVAAIYGLRAPFLLFGGACGLALLLVFIFVRSKNSSGQTMVPAPGVHGNALISTLKSHHQILAVAGAGQLFAQAIRAGRDVIIPLYAADVLGLDVRAIGLIVSVSWAIDMTLFYPAGLLMDRWGRKFAIVPCFLIQTIGMALIPLTAGFGSLLAVAGLIGFGNGLGSGTMMTLGADLAPVEVRGEFLGVWRLIGDVGSSGAPLVVGTVAGLVVLQTAAGVMAAAGLVSVLIFAFLVPETLEKGRRVGTGYSSPQPE